MLKSDNLKAELRELKKEAKELLNKEGVTEKEIRNKSNEIDILQARIEQQEIAEEEERKRMKNRTGFHEYGKERVNNSGSYTILNKDESFFKATFEEEKQDLEIGKYIKGMITGDWSNAYKEREQYMALNTSTGTTLIPRELSAQIVDLARSQMALRNIPIIPMKTNNLTIAKITKDPEFVFKEELAESDISDMSFGKVELKSKTIYGLMKVSLELFESAQNLEEVIKDAMAKAIAQGIDKSGLYGNGETEPKGILTYDNINTIESANISKTKYSSIVKGIGEITKANGMPNTIIYNSNIDTEFNLLCDTTGQPLNTPKVI